MDGIKNFVTAIIMCVLASSIAELLIDHEQREIEGSLKYQSDPIREMLRVKNLPCNETHYGVVTKKDFCSTYGDIVFLKFANEICGSGVQIGDICREIQDLDMKESCKSAFRSEICPHFQELNSNELKGLWHNMHSVKCEQIASTHNCDGHLLNGMKDICSDIINHICSSIGQNFVASICRKNLTVRICKKN